MTIMSLVFIFMSDPYLWIISISKYFMLFIYIICVFDSRIASECIFVNIFINFGQFTPCLFFESDPCRFDKICIDSWTLYVHPAKVYLKVTYTAQDLGSLI